MEEQEEKNVLEWLAKAHKQVEHVYLQNPAVKGSPEWLQKRRMLLADLGIHLVQAAVAGKEIDNQKIKRALFSVLTIADEFIPNSGLAETANNLYKESYLQE